MELYLRGHTYKYAVEQMLLTLFPDERPEYPEGRPRGRGMEISLSRGARFTTAACALRTEDGVFRGRAAVENAALTDPLVTDRKCQRLVKNAMYRAALRAGHQKPVWGALTGVRPGKLLCGFLRQGLGEQEALQRFTEEFDVSPERAALCLDASRHTMAAEESLEARDLCLYVGIPFCPTRCAYCSFVSQSVEKSMKLIPPFLDALELEIRATAAQVRALGLRPVSVYFGGGTPTTLSAAQIKRLMEAVNRHFDRSRLIEYTVEAGRPDTIDPEKLRVIRDLGANRVSINPQTMNDAVLRAVGRPHTAADVERAYAQAAAAGFTSINMDLIAGLPGDDPESFARSLDRVLALDPSNITVHTLALKKGAELFSRREALPPQAAVEAMVDRANAVLSGKGYEPYYLYRQKYMSGSLENVGWCRDGDLCLYNVYMMEELTDILALGGGAVSKRLLPEHRLERQCNPKYPKQYVERIEEVLAEKSALLEQLTSGEKPGIINQLNP